MRWTRKLQHLDTTFDVVIGPLEQDASTGNFWCEWAVELGHGRSGKTLGIDEIQAILLAAQTIRLTVEGTAEFQDGNIVWEGGLNPSDLGLPPTT